MSFLRHLRTNRNAAIGFAFAVISLACSGVAIALEVLK